MGSIDIKHVYEDYDWRLGLDIIQSRSQAVKGYSDGYSGEIHDITNITFIGDLTNNKDKNMIINERLQRLDKRQGEVAIIDRVGYSIAKPVIKDYLFPLALDPRELRGFKSPAALYEVLDLPGHMRFVGDGSVAELKKRAKCLIMDKKFQYDYIIVGKNIANPLLITGEGKRVRNTSQKSNDNQLVLPYYKYIVYGRAPY